MLRRRSPSKSLERQLRTIQESAEAIRPDDPALSEWYGRYVKSQANRLAFDLSMVQREVAPGARILECGAAPYLLTLSLSANFDLVGVDLAPERFATSIEHHQLSVVRCDIERERLPFENDSFDAILFNELFEHLRQDLIFTLSEVRRVLKPDGVLFLSTPNLRSLHGIVNFAVRGKAYSCSAEIYEEYRKLEEIGHMGHVREYTTIEVTNFLKAVGFSVRSLLYRGLHRNRLEQLLFRCAPPLRPFVTYVASK